MGGKETDRRGMETRKREREKRRRRRSGSSKGFNRTIGSRKKRTMSRRNTSSKRVIVLMPMKAAIVMTGAERAMSLRYDVNRM